MPKDVRDAGAKIRREIQRRYGLIDYESRCGDITQNVRPRRAYRFNMTCRGDPIVYPDRAAAAFAEYDALTEAYHAWSQTAQRSYPYKADPALLQSVFLAD